MKKRSGWPLWRGWGVTSPPSLTASSRENVDSFLSYTKRQNNPKYGNLSKFSHLPDRFGGEEGGQPKRSAWPLFQSFFWQLPLLTKEFIKCRNFVLTPNNHNDVNFLVGRCQVCKTGGGSPPSPYHPKRAALSWRQNKPFKSSTSLHPSLLRSVNVVHTKACSCAIDFAKVGQRS